MIEDTSLTHCKAKTADFVTVYVIFVTLTKCDPYLISTSPKNYSSKEQNLCGEGNMNLGIDIATMFYGN